MLQSVLKNSNNTGKHICFQIINTGLIVCKKQTKPFVKMKFFQLFKL